MVIVWFRTSNFCPSLILAGYPVCGLETAAGPVQQVLKVIVSNRLMVTSLYLPSGHLIRASLVAQMVKSLPAMQETQVRVLGWEDPLKKGMATHSSILAWRIPLIEELGRLQSMGLQRVRND